jgi:cell division protein FtsL
MLQNSYAISTHVTLRKYKLLQTSSKFTLLRESIDIPPKRTIRTYNSITITILLCLNKNFYFCILQNSYAISIHVTLRKYKLLQTSSKFTRLRESIDIPPKRTIWTYNSITITILLCLNKNFYFCMLQNSYAISTHVILRKYKLPQTSSKFTRLRESIDIPPKRTIWTYNFIAITILLYLNKNFYFCMLQNSYAISTHVILRKYKLPQTSSNFAQLWESFDIFSKRTI